MQTIAAGLVRWLRPDYQNPAGRTATAKGQQAELDVGTATDAAGKALPEQVASQFKRACAA